jgi:predicted ATPase
MGVPLIAARGFAHPRVEEVYSRARALCLELDDRTELFRVLWGLWSFRYVTLRLDDAYEVAYSLLDLATKANDVALLVLSHNALGQLCCYRGDSVAALEHFERVVTLYDPQAHRDDPQTYGYDQCAVARAFRAWMLWTVGYPDRALQEMETALRTARALAHARTLVTVLYFSAVLHQFRGEWEAGRRYGEELLSLATDRSLAHFVGIGKVVIGWGRTHHGERELGIAQMREGLAAYQATGARTSASRFRAQLAEQLGKAGRLDEALAIVAEEIGATGLARYHLAELYRVQGELLLLNGGSVAASEADSCLLRAIEVARAQQARSFELRAAISLCRCRRRAGAEDEARQLLEEAYSWFSEGFDTDDLKEARILLDAPTRSRSMTGG